MELKEKTEKELRAIEKVTGAGKPNLIFERNQRLRVKKTGSSQDALTIYIVQDIILQNFK